MNFFLEESTTETVPCVLQEIIQDVVAHSKCHDSVQKDIMMVLIIVLMMENGFLPVESGATVINDVSYINARHLLSWKSCSDMMKIRFFLSGFEDIPLMLIVSSLGSTAIVNVIINDLSAETYTVCIPVSRYIVSPLASTIPMMFRDLKHLVNMYKNKICAPVKSRIHGLCGYPSASLTGVPEEVFYKISKNLPVYELVKLSETCKRIQFLIDNQSLWCDLYKRDFGVEGILDSPENSDWKDFYKEKYITKREAMIRETRSLSESRYNFMEYTDLMPDFEYSHWDSMIT